MQAEEPVAPWVKLESAPAYEGYVRVRRDTYRLADGSVSGWDVLEEGATVAVIAFTTTGGTLLFEQYRVGPERVVGELPGGLVDPGEEPIDAAARELDEETGYRAAALFHAGSEWGAGNSTRRKHVVVAVGCVRVAAPRWEAGEMGRVTEIPASALLAHLLSGDLSDAGEAVRGLHVFARAALDDVRLAAGQALVRTLLAGGLT